MKILIQSIIGGILFYTLFSIMFLFTFILRGAYRVYCKLYHLFNKESEKDCFISRNILPLQHV